jgi:hypothetical protein
VRADLALTMSGAMQRRFVIIDLLSLGFIARSILHPPPSIFAFGIAPFMSIREIRVRDPT